MVVLELIGGQGRGGSLLRGLVRAFQKINLNENIIDVVIFAWTFNVYRLSYRRSGRRIDVMKSNGDIEFAFVFHFPARNQSYFHFYLDIL